MSQRRTLPPGVRPLPSEPIVPVPPGERRRLSPQQALELANKHYTAGDSQRALSILQPLLQAAPDMHEAFHLSGVISHQLGKVDAGVALVARAVELQPDVAQYRSNLAEMYRLGCRLEEALEQGEKAVQSDPQSAVAHSNLGIAYYDARDYDTAEQCQNRALELNPGLAAARNNLGSIFRERKDRVAAIDCYEQVLRLQPDHLEAMNNLGAVLTEEERYEEAVELLRQVIQRKPDFADAHSNIGNAFVALENYDLAVRAFEQALRLRTDYAEPLLGLARVYQEQGKLEQAEEAANRVLQIDGERAEAYCPLALVYAEQGFPDRAMECWDRALDLDGSLQRAYIGKGSLLMEMGQLKEAEQCQLQALEQDADTLAARVALTQVRKTKAGDGNLLELEQRALDIDSMHPSKAMSLHFALGKCYDDIGDHERAFPHFMSACSLKRSTIEYSPQDTEALVDQLLDFFDHQRFKAVASGDSSDLPVFVLGMARSGTTLTEQIIASHPQVHGAGELPDLLALAHSLDDAEAQLFYPSTLAGLSGAQLREMGARYIHGLQARCPDALRITDKMPANFFAVGLIQMLLPEARIVHVRRNPLDTCISGFSKLYNRGQAYSYDLSELGHYYRQYARLMQHWQEVLPAGRMLEVQYEDLVADQEQQARRIIDYCGLDWSDQCLDFHNTKRSVRTASVAQVRQQIYRSSVERWRRYEKFLQPLCDALGPDLAGQR